MRIAFYAPLKPPDHPVASGDRAMARALLAALRQAGHDVEVASRFRSYDAGDPERQRRIRNAGLRLAERFVRRAGLQPDLWLTYHLYHKAPDWLGPAVSARLGIPYLVAEASYAPKQEGGRWHLGHRAVEDAIRQAARIFQPNPADAACVLPLLASPEQLAPLPPFLDAQPFREYGRPASRTALAERWNLDAGEPWLIAVAMMRNDQKLSSYRCLADALTRVRDAPWRLIVAGAGPAEAVVRAAFAPLDGRVRWVGMLDSATLRQAYRASDLYVWPAIKEAWGMALLEAQASGLPVVAGRSGGVAAIVADGESGVLVEEGNAAGFAAALRLLLAQPQVRAAMGEAAECRIAREHDIAGAAARLDKHIRELTAMR